MNFIMVDLVELRTVSIIKIIHDNLSVFIKSTEADFGKSISLSFLELQFSYRSVFSYFDVFCTIFDPLWLSVIWHFLLYRSLMEESQFWL